MQSRLPCRGNISDSWPYPTTKFLRAHLCLLFFMKWIGSFSKKETSLCRLRSYPHPALSPQGARVVRFFASLRMTMTGGGAERDPGGAEDGTPESSGLRRGSRLSTSGWLGDRTRAISIECHRGVGDGGVVLVHGGAIVAQHAPFRRGASWTAEELQHREERRQQPDAARVILLLDELQEGLRITVLRVLKHRQVCLHRLVEREVRRRLEIAVAHADVGQVPADHEAHLLAEARQGLAERLDKLPDALPLGEQVCVAEMQM